MAAIFHLWGANLDDPHKILDSLHSCANLAGIGSTVFII